MILALKFEGNRASDLTVDSLLSRPHRGGAGGAVRAEGWGWRYAGRRQFAVRGLDLAIDPGECVLLSGRSGAGKSTLLSALAGVLGGSDEGEHEGSITIDGIPPVDARGRTGLVLQDPDSQIVLARVGDDVAFSCENLGVARSEIWPRVCRALDDVGLDVSLDAPTSTLSGGQKQRLALAGVLAMRPRIILLDEPTANLDPNGVLDVHDAVRRVHERTGATLIIIDHRMSVWRDLVGRMIVLGGGGGVVTDGPIDRVLDEHADARRSVGAWAPSYTPHRSGGRTTTLLTAASLSVGRERARGAATAIDLTIRGGEALAITGPNGAGKSTLALTLAGLVRPTSGSLRASKAFASGAGVEPITWSSRALLARIGTVFQNPEHQFVAATVREELAVGPRVLRLSSKTATARIDELMQRLRLDALAEANPFTLSGGEKRRLSVATALVTRPGLLVVDEPTIGQDSHTWCDVVSLLSESVRDGTGVVAVTHDADLMTALRAREVHLNRDPVGTVAHDVPFTAFTSAS